MRVKWVIAGFVAFLIFGGEVCMARALYGKVTAVTSADVVTLDYTTGHYVVRIVGVDVPKEGPIAGEAKDFVARLVLGKNVRMLLGSRAENGDMVSQLFTDDPAIGIKDVGLELIRAGLARRQQGEDYQFGYKYGELSAAMREAQKARRGLWATTQP